MTRPETIAPPDVLAVYRAAVEADPNSIQAQTNLGWGLYGNDQYEAAIKQFERALELNGDFFDARYGLALAAKKAGQTTQAVLEFEKTSTLLTQIEDKARAQVLSRIIQKHLGDLRSGSS